MENSRNETVSAKGFYYNLEKSPHVWISPCGDSYRLPSAKRVEMMEKYSAQEITKLSRFLAKTGLDETLPPEIIHLLQRSLLDAVYNRIVG